MNASKGAARCCAALRGSLRDAAMERKFWAAAVLLAAGGCRMCSDACDYSSPVPGGPRSGSLQRAGSAFNGQVYNTVAPPPQKSPATEADLNPYWEPPLEGPPTPQPMPAP
jgi:hypothetical protein